MTAPDLTPILFDDVDLMSVPVRVGDKWYCLREGTEDQIARYRDAIAKSTRIDSDTKVTTFDGLNATEALLLSLTLYHSVDEGRSPQKDGAGHDLPVPVEVIRRWPHRVAGPLFDRAEQLNGMGKWRPKDNGDAAGLREAAKN